MCFLSVTCFAHVQFLTTCLKARHSFFVQQVRSLLLEQEQRRGQPFYEGEPIQRQSVSMLCHTLEKSIQRLEVEIEAKHHKNNDVSTDGLMYLA